MFFYGFKNKSSNNKIPHHKPFLKMYHFNKIAWHNHQQHCEHVLHTCAKYYDKIPIHFNWSKLWMKIVICALCTQKRQYNLPMMNEDRSCGFIYLFSQLMEPLLIYLLRFTPDATLLVFISLMRNKNSLRKPGSCEENYVHCNEQLIKYFSLPSSRQFQFITTTSIYLRQS